MNRVRSTSILALVALLSAVAWSGCTATSMNVEKFKTVKKVAILTIAADPGFRGAGKAIFAQDVTDYLCNTLNPKIAGDFRQSLKDWGCFEIAGPEVLAQVEEYAQASALGPFDRPAIDGTKYLRPDEQKALIQTIVQKAGLDAAIIIDWQWQVTNPATNPQTHVTQTDLKAVPEVWMFHKDGEEIWNGSCWIRPPADCGLPLTSGPGDMIMILQQKEYGYIEGNPTAGSIGLASVKAALDKMVPLAIKEIIDQAKDALE
jgi:hypothetical protein